MKERILKIIKNNAGSSLVITLFTLFILVMGTVAFWQSVVLYTSTVNREEIQKQSYLSARSVCQTLANLILETDPNDEADNSPLKAVVQRMTPDEDDIKAWYENTANDDNKSGWKNQNLWYDSVLDLGKVTFAGSPNDVNMGEVTATIEQKDWTHYEITTTSVVNKEEHVVKATIEMNHFVTHVTVDGSTIVGSTDEVKYDGTEGSEDIEIGSEGYEIPVFTPGGLFVYTEYGIDYPANFSTFNMAVSTATLVSEQPIIFFSNESLTIQKAFYSQQDIYFEENAVSQKYTELHSMQNIVFGSQNHSNLFGGSLAIAKDRIEIRGSTSLEHAELKSDIFVLADGEFTGGTSEGVNGSIFANYIYLLGGSFKYTGNVHFNDGLYIDSDIDVNTWGSLDFTTSNGKAYVIDSSGNYVEISGSGSFYDNGSTGIAVYEADRTFTESQIREIFSIEDSTVISYYDNTLIYSLGGSTVDGNWKENLVAYKYTYANEQWDWVHGILKSPNEGGWQISDWDFGEGNNGDYEWKFRFNITNTNSDVEIDEVLELERANVYSSVYEDSSFIQTTTAGQTIFDGEGGQYYYLPDNLSLYSSIFTNMDMNNPIIFVVKDGEHKNIEGFYQEQYDDDGKPKGGLCFLIFGKGSIEFLHGGSYNVYVKQSEQHDIIKAEYVSAINSKISSASKNSTVSGIINYYSNLDNLVDYSEVRAAMQVVTDKYKTQINNKLEYVDGSKEFGYTILPNGTVLGTIYLPFLDNWESGSNVSDGTGYMFYEEREEGDDSDNSGMTGGSTDGYYDVTEGTNGGFIPENQWELTTDGQSAVTVESSFKINKYWS